MSTSIQRLGRSVAIAVITAGAVLVGASTAGAAPASSDTTTIKTPQVTSVTDPGLHTVTATLTSDRFVQNAATHSIDVVDAQGKTLESIPLTMRGKAIPVAADVSQNGRAMTLKQVSFTDTGNQLINQWVWGVQHGGAVGAIIGCLLGFWLFVIPGCAIGAAIGGTIGSPNGAQINGTFFRLISGN
ncbi:hypothetical protein [Nocardia alni]|uniref:hypothetical protein n=1 Tax=Nocardia alni TaxID=2815723 RepID=UPI001C226B4C|nr:hypothetical protein [Nocardia alni]